MKMSKEVDLGKERIGRLFFMLAVPAILSQLVNALYNMVDRMYIGHIPEVGATALTGVGISFPIIMIISAFAALVAMGGAPRASILMGQQDIKGAEKILGNCCCALIITALVLTIAVIGFHTPLLYMFGASENTIGYAQSYMIIYAAGTIFRPAYAWDERLYIRAGLQQNQYADRCNRSYHQYHFGSDTDFCFRYGSAGCCARHGYIAGDFFRLGHALSDGKADDIEAAYEQFPYKSKGAVTLTCLRCCTLHNAINGKYSRIVL